MPKETYQGEARCADLLLEKGLEDDKKTGHSEGLVVQAGFADGAVQEPTCQCKRCGKLGALSGRSPRGGHKSHSSPALENPMDGGAWRGVPVCGVVKSWA